MTPAETKDTSEKLMDAAEQLFGDHGVEGASLRDITAAAEANVAAVNYHFGSKEGLIRAVFERRFGPLNNERIRMLDLADSAAGDSAPTIDAILHAFIGPTFRFARRYPEFMRMAGRYHLETNASCQEMLQTGRFPELIARMEKLVTAAEPDVDLAELWWRMHFVVGAMIHSWASASKMEEISRGIVKWGTDDEMTGRLVEFGAAGIRAARKKKEIEG